MGAFGPDEREYCPAPRHVPTVGERLEEPKTEGRAHDIAREGVARDVIGKGMPAASIHISFLISS